MNKYNKIVLVSLCDSWNKSLAALLSQNLGMLFCDTKDLIEYELIDKKAIENLCSKEYLDLSEEKVIKHMASFENVVVSISYDYLFKHINHLKENSLIVFIKLSKRFVEQNADVVNKISYKSRTQILEKLADITVGLRNTDLGFAYEKIINQLRGSL